MKINITSVPVADQDDALRFYFTSQPADVGTAVIAVFDDTCGNLIQLYEEK